MSERKANSYQPPSIEDILEMAEGVSQRIEVARTKLPAGAEYPGGILGNYEFPANFKLPDLCADCPLNNGLVKPKIERVYTDHSNAITGLSPYPKPLYPGIPIIEIAYLLEDADNTDYQPAILDVRSPGNTSSVTSESTDSRAMGWANRQADSCDKPIENKPSPFQRLRGRQLGGVACGAGFQGVPRRLFRDGQFTGFDPVADIFHKSSLTLPEPHQS